MTPQINRGRFPDIEGILEAIEATGPTTGHYRKHEEHERKYEANGNENSIPVRRLQFHHLLFELIKSHNAFEILVNEQFGGVDECFEFFGPPGSNVVTMHRMRFGSNRSGRYTVKQRSVNGDNTARQHVSLPLSYRDYNKQRQILQWMAESAHSHRHSLVGQSGDFWFVHDHASKKIVEIVLYKAGRAERDAQSPLRLLAEIAPKGCETVEEAIIIIERYEALLHLSGRRILQSNMEIFAEK